MMWTTRNVRLLIFMLGFITTILVNVLAQRHVQDLHRSENLAPSWAKRKGEGEMTDGTSPESWEEAIRTLHKKNAGKVRREKRSQTDTIAPVPVPALLRAAAPASPRAVMQLKLPGDPTQSMPQGSELHELIGTALKYTRPGNHKLCVMEVGTADGKGTTVQLVRALQTYSQANANREWHVTTYEGLPKLFQNARWEWQLAPNVRVVNELMMSQHNLEKFVFPHITGPPTQEWPGAPFYFNLYNGTAAQISKGEMGAFVHTFPACKLDLILIDSTRFAHLGIVKTIMDRKGLTDAETIWVVENDFWEGGGDERQVLEKGVGFDFIAGEYPAGEMWPWIYFRIASKYFE